MISHLNIQNYINWAADYFEIESKDAILNTSPLHFDMSVFDIFCPLAVGASVTLVPHQIQLFPLKLIEIISRRNITVWKAVSFLLAYFVRARALHPDRMPSLRKIIFSGEPLPTKYLIEWMQTYPDKHFFNAYGPTEATGISTCYRILRVPQSADVPIPIGTACANMEAFAVDSEGKQVITNGIGELYIRGSGLSRGYWNDSQRTSEAFCDYPIEKTSPERVYKTGDLVKRTPSGDFIFVGRKDHQLKYLGYRIEAGEIESALCALDNVMESAVLAINGNGNPNPEIIAFIQLDRAVNPASIKVCLKERLPAYMIPHKILVLPALPRTANGKIDRQRLKEYFKNPTPAPRVAAEQNL